VPEWEYAVDQVMLVGMDAGSAARVGFAQRKSADAGCPVARWDYTSVSEFAIKSSTDKQLRSRQLEEA
jgi:hypothetical protein